MHDVTPEIEAQIDALYALPLASFVGARQGLAKTLNRDAARAVKALVKPTTVAWVVNQVRWHDPGAYERVLAAGASSP